MDKSSIRNLLVGLAIATGAALALYGAVEGNEPLLAVGLPVAVLALILVPVMRKRTSVERKLENADGVLADWEYSGEEARTIAGEIRRASRKRNLCIALLLSVCLAVIFLPFVMISLSETGRLAPAMIGAFAAIAALPWAVALVEPAFAARRVLKLPCRTVVCRNCLMVANRYHPLNDYHKLNAESAKLTPAAGGGMPVLSVDYSYRAGKTLGLYRKTVEIPVPSGCERAAEGICLLFRH